MRDVESVQHLCTGERKAAIKLHRCPNLWFKISAHPCWKVQKAPDELLWGYSPRPSARPRIDAVPFGGAQGASPLGGVVAVVLSPRAIYAVAGLLGLAAAGLVAVTGASRTSTRATPVDASVG